MRNCLARFLGKRRRHMTAFGRICTLKETYLARITFKEEQKMHLQIWFLLLIIPTLMAGTTGHNYDDDVSFMIKNFVTIQITVITMNMATISPTCLAPWWQ